MNNKKAILLALVASLAITPILVARLASPPGSSHSIPHGRVDESPRSPANGDVGASLRWMVAQIENPRSRENIVVDGQKIPIPMPPDRAIAPESRNTPTAAVNLPAGPQTLIVEKPAPVNNPPQLQLQPYLGRAEAVKQPSTIPTPSYLRQTPQGTIVLTAQPGTQQPPPVGQPPVAPNPSVAQLSVGGNQFSPLGTQPANASENLKDQQKSAPSTILSNPPSEGNLGGADILSKSPGAAGVEVQRRSPLIGDPRIEGLHFGQIVTQADGGYWFPARVDLDTVVSKLNASSIGNMLIIKGPFSVRYGPGFSFLDIESIGTPRSTSGCFEAGGSTSLNYRTNGQAWQGQQSLWGGNANWGFRLDYNIQAAGDYHTGNGSSMPSSYNNQFVNFAYGINLTPDSSLEVKYLHVQQYDVLIPGLLTNINSLATDAFTGRYTSVNGGWYDRLTIDTWINNTRFDGDSSNPETRRQIPQLNNVFPTGIPGATAQQNAANQALFNAFGPVRLDITTNGNALSWGFREITTWGDTKGFNMSLGADFRFFSSNYNEYDSFNSSIAPGATGPTAFPANLGIPAARQLDPGILADASIPVGDNLTFKVGTRVDFITSQFMGFGSFTDQATYNNNNPGAQNDKAFMCFAGFATADYKLCDEWTVQSGYGYAQRPPTLTELYSGGAFFGLIQNGFNSIYGNASLRREEMHQLNLGIKGNYEQLRLGANAFYAFMPNYVTYNNVYFNASDLFSVDFAQTRNGTPIQGTTPIRKFIFVNTPFATLYGFDAYGEYDALPYVTPFATLGFVEGWDQTKGEALPGIPPLNSRVGVRFHEAGKNQRWGVEYFARMVATQNLFAASLGEQRTGGFVVHNLRGFWQASEKLLFLAGVENIGDLQYREHLDLRTGLGVFQPGVNFYAGMKLTY